MRESNLGGGARFSAPVRRVPGAHTASYTMGTGSFPGVKRPGRGVDQQPPSSTEAEGRVELYIYTPPLHLLASSRMKFTFTCPRYWSRAMAGRQLITLLPRVGSDLIRAVVRFKSSQGQ